jgi:hypothetical protein
MTQIHIILENEGGELDRKIINPSMDDQEAVTQTVYNLLAGSDWMLAVGDTIRIVEVE